jgi:alpha-1,6-mannosyltransferase
MRMLGLSLLAVVFLGPVVQPWYVLWGLTVLAATRLGWRPWPVFAGGCFWLSMMIAPQGSNLFLDWGPVIAMPLAAIVATIAVLGRSGDDPPAGPEKLVVPAPTGRELGPVATVR